jgi:hypothetical protein
VCKSTPGCGGPVQACAINAMEPKMAETWRTEFGKKIIPEAFAQEVCKEQLSSYESEMEEMENGIQERHRIATLAMFSRISAKKRKVINEAMAQLDELEAQENPPAPEWMLRPKPAPPSNELP